MKTTHIHITGIVQGVGFRPRVYKLARESGLTGWVNNSADGVHIELQGSKEDQEHLVGQLRENPPEMARITSCEMYETDREVFDDFMIIDSERIAKKSVLLTPDYAICNACEAELEDPENRRYRYPFITCTCCGPRFSIIDALPYDRERTSMEPFEMCSRCREEYNDVYDRRYYSQTNSCPSCAIQLQYHRDGKMTAGDNDGIVRRIVEDLGSGDIVAVKGIGGYLLMCDATNAEAVNLLRQRKGRPTKPLALIYPSEEMMEGDVIVRPCEQEEYFSVEAPIILFKIKSKPRSGIAVKAVAPGLSRIGIMRPCAPLLTLVCKDFRRPLVATSGNLSGSPIIYDDKKALRSLSWIADAIVSHDRCINMPEDDSVVMFTAENCERIVLRRSRGIAPNYFGPSNRSESGTLAVGASLKSTFALQHGSNTYVSQYLGDQDSFDTQESFRSTLRHMSNVLEFRPKRVLTDLHPHYSSTTLGKRIAREEDIPLKKIQHHEAHFAAVLSENGLLDSDEEILGVVWDGTGYGKDGNIWGGEFFRFANGEIDRLTHFDYYSHILGNKMPREPRLAALTLLYNTMEEGMLRDFFTTEEWEYYHKVLRHEPELKTSSVGRLFDAAACLLGLGDKISYEGEAAIALESLAGFARKRDTIFIDPDKAMSPAYHLLRMMQLTRQGYTKSDAAWHFHAGMIQAIQLIARKYGITNLAFSGGVFQNGLLVDLICETFDNYKLYFHKELSPNDESISFGQLMYAMNEVRSVGQSEFGHDLVKN